MPSRQDQPEDCPNDPLSGLIPHLYLLNLPSENPFLGIITSSSIHEKKLNNFNTIKFFCKINSVEKLKSKLNNNIIILENSTIERRRDQFIGQEIDRWFREREAQRRQPLVVRQSIPEPAVYLPMNSNLVFSSRTGLYAQIYEQAVEVDDSTVNGQQLITKGMRYGNVDFTPGNRTRFDPRHMTDSITKAIQGLMDLLEAIDQGRFEAVPILRGTTNIHMALFAQRLGFEVIDICRTSDGKINSGLQRYTVIGKLDVIRRRTEELSQAHLSRLEKRSQRLQLEPALVR